MEDIVKVSAVSYLNTKPLIYGFDKTALKNHIQLNIEYPALVAQSLQSQKADIGLVPVAAIPSIPNAQIISDYCIAALDNVASVCIFSEVPIEKVTDVYLDYQSRTSVRLAQVLIEEYWQQNVNYLQADEDYIAKIKGTKAGVIIGDRALKNLNNFPFVYDLSLFWNKMTGLPFVFAAWVANRSLSEEFIQLFNEANAYGFNHLEKVIAENEVDYYNIKEYYSQNILYNLDAEKRKGLDLFLNKINTTINII